MSALLSAYQDLFVCALLCQSLKEAQRNGVKTIVGDPMEEALVAMANYTAIGHLIFATALVPIAAWLFALPFAIFMLGAEEARKALARIRNGGSTATGRLVRNVRTSKRRR